MNDKIIKDLIRELAADRLSREKMTRENRKLYENMMKQVLPLVKQLMPQPPIQHHMLMPSNEEQTCPECGLKIRKLPSTTPIPIS